MTGIRHMPMFAQGIHSLSQISGLRIQRVSIASASDHTKAIVEAAFEPQHPSELCLATVEPLIFILAGKAGNLALKVLATGGVYLAGGIAVHLVTLVQKPEFVQNFHQKRPL